MTKLALVLGLTFGTSVLVAACGSTAINEGAEPGGGAGGGGAGQPNGGSGAAEPGGCTQHSDCKSFGDCETLGEFEAICRDWGDDFVRYASSCGGTYVEQMDGVTASSWVFDANGKPIGAFYEGEHSCSQWGAQCGPTGPGTPLCSDECTTLGSCEAWARGTWATVFGCPATLDALSEYCRLGEKLERQASGCGGTIISTVAALPSSTWIFDGAGKLVAASAAGDVGDCWRWGTQCDEPPVGTIEPLCGSGGEGGMGGQGNAGAGAGGEGGGSGAGGAAGAGGSD